MIELLLMRHAKSSWEGEGLADHERPLSGRGRNAAEAMGLHMAASGLVPDLVLCSPARRARGTWDIAARHLPGVGQVEIADGLYDFGDGSRLLDIIRTRGGASRRLMLVGHNPAIEQLARRLTGSGDAELRARLDAKFPTGTLAVLQFGAGSWTEIALGEARLAAFMRPGDIQTSDDV